MDNTIFGVQVFPCPILILFITFFIDCEHYRNMLYRMAEESDIESILGLVQSAILEMERQGIFQWDSIYPSRDDFLDDIREETLFVGMADQEIAVVFTVNKACDEQYKNGAWKYPNTEYRIIHRLCVDPKYQNMGIAKETLDQIENELRQVGVESIRLDVFYNNPFALSLYRNRGYKEVGTAEWRKGKFYLMEKHL